MILNDLHTTQLYDQIKFQTWDTIFDVMCSNISLPILNHLLIQIHTDTINWSGK
jgi:hypothetical protein